MKVYLKISKRLIHNWMKIKAILKKSLTKTKQKNRKKLGFKNTNNKRLVNKIRIKKNAKDID